MKPFHRLLAACGLSGIILICNQAFAQNAAVRSLEKPISPTVTFNWTDSETLVLNPKTSWAATRTTTKVGVWLNEDQAGFHGRVEVIAIPVQAEGMIYFCARTPNDFYVVSESNIAIFSLGLSPELYVTTTSRPPYFSAKLSAGLEAATAEFQSKFDLSAFKQYYADATTVEIDFRKFVDKDFFRPAKGGTSSYVPRIISVTMKLDTLRLELENDRSGDVASIWIDSKSKELTRVIFNGDDINITAWLTIWLRVLALVLILCCAFYAAFRWPRMVKLSPH